MSGTRLWCLIQKKLAVRGNFQPAARITLRTGKGQSRSLYFAIPAILPGHAPWATRSASRSKHCRTSRHDMSRLRHIPSPKMQHLSRDRAWLSKRSGFAPVHCSMSSPPASPRRNMKKAGDTSTPVHPAIRGQQMRERSVYRTRLHAQLFRGELHCANCAISHELNEANVTEPR